MCIKVKCVEKIRDNNNNEIIEYVLEDSTGNRQRINSSQLKDLITNRSLEVTNLTLTSNNRLVGKEKTRKTWDEWYEIACKILNSHRSITQTTIDENDNKIGKWIMNQRLAYRQGKLTKEQIQKLYAIGMLHKPAKTWDDRYSIAFKIVNAGGKISQSTVDCDGNKVGSWVNDQRKAKSKGKLTQEQIDKLNRLGLLVETYKSWDEWYKIVDKLIASGVKITQSYVDELGNKVGIWVSAQRQLYRQGSLSPEKIQKLNKLGLLAGLRDRQDWFIRFEQLRKAIESGIVITAKTVDDEGNKVGAWLYNQKKFYKQGKLNDNQIQLLESLDLLENCRRSWDEYYERVVRIIESGNSIETKTIDADGFHIGRWVMSQRYAYKHNNLTQEHIQKLSTLGLLESNLDKIWNDNYESACKIINSGNKITQRTKCANGKNIGRWVIKQKHLYTDGKLPTEKEKKLRDLGIIGKEQIIDTNDTWDTWYERAYKAVNSGKKVTYATIDDEGNRVGYWIRYQIKLYTQGKLDNIQIQKLKEIGLI